MADAWDWADVMALGVMLQMDLHPWDLGQYIDELTGPWHHFVAAAIRTAYADGERDGFRRGVQETFATARRARRANG